jgi:peptidoglycan/LPS O-acetylase OafA/YrhL
MRVKCRFWCNRYFPALDGLRALGAAFVIFHHLHVPYPRAIKGWFGVDVFFVLSGFLVTTLLLRERDEFGNADLKGLNVRRFFRIVPVYMIVLAAHPVLILLTHDTLRWREFLVALPYLLLFMQEFRPPSAGNLFALSWTLGYQEKFHFVWPWILMPLIGKRRRFWTVIAILSVALAFAPPTVMRAYGGHLLGALVAVVLHEEPRIHRWFHHVRASMAGAVMAAGYVLSSTAQSRFTILFALGSALLIGNLVLKDGWLGKVLQNRFLVLAGKRSYAIYLVHVLVMHIADIVGQRLHAYYWWFVVPVTFALSFGISTGLHHAVEKPLMAYSRKLSQSYRQKKEPAQQSVEIHADVYM